MRGKLKDLNPPVNSVVCFITSPSAEVESDGLFYVVRNNGTEKPGCCDTERLWGQRIGVDGTKAWISDAAVVKLVSVPATELRVGDTVMYGPVSPVSLSPMSKGVVDTLTNSEYGVRARVKWRNGMYTCMPVDRYNVPAPVVRGEMIRTVTKRVLREGRYGNLTVYRAGGRLRIETTKSQHTREELQEMVHLLNQIIEAYDDIA